MIRISTLLGAGVAIGLAGSALGSFAISWDPVQIDPLDLGSDGQWTEGEEWMHSGVNETIQLFETWVGAYGSNVVLGTSLGDGGTRALTPVSLDKDVFNSSGFFWNSFQVDLQAGAGATISNLNALTNAQFADVSITDNGGGSFTILWSQGAGAGVGLGSTADLLFSFDIDGVLSFSQVQTPLPTPGAAALFGVAGLAGLRRRR